MKKGWLLVAGVLLLAMVAVPLAGCAGTVTASGDGVISSQQTGIWVNGEGKVSAVPDVATLRLGIEVQGVSVTVAQADAAEAMNKVLAALAGHGIADEDIQTQYYSIRKITRWDKDREQEIVIGYRVTNTVTAKIREIEMAGTIIDAVAAAGGDLTRIDDISFSIDDPSVYYEEAREKAMADAQAKAMQLAQLAGVTLGKPTYITESGYIPYPVYRIPTAEVSEPMPAPTPVMPGEVEISVNVSLAYAIL